MKKKNKMKNIQKKIFMLIQCVKLGFLWTTYMLLENKITLKSHKQENLKFNGITGLSRPIGI
jgi:hypothetical protein